ncbi:glycosyltransferase family 2 protein [Tamlana sp. s12]|uniref:glycosyltransferase family 2 protein n=1 Tax=Tamlana sp. s12 TaxID=1630406 RepID=UPI000839154F|nr:glycosyltransferase family 2 protein [Tamlana sp. s12]QQY80918.1 glycosyltransferase family 2 protein [Tamlana sp. s12]
MSEPLVSIIIPTFNRAHLIRETLDSVLAQTYINWECVVVDDGSTDDTDTVMAEYCAKDTRFQYHHRPKDRLPGGNAARNYGFEVSKGEYVNWFDDDDVMLTGFLQQKINAFIENIQFVVCSGTYVSHNLQNPEPINLKLDTYLYKDYVLWNFKIVTNNVTFKREFFEGKKLFDINLLRGQETELLSRLFFNISEEQYKIINEPLFLYRQHEFTKTTLNKKYVPKFKFAQSHINIENLRRSIELKDCELVNYCFETLVVFYFQSLEFKDYKTTGYIYKRLCEILKTINRSVYLEFKLLGGGLFIFQGNSSRLCKYMKSRTIC